jgi:hypothetical protein
LIRVEYLHQYHIGWALLDSSWLPCDGARQLVCRGHVVGISLVLDEKFRFFYLFCGDKIKIV